VKKQLARLVTLPPDTPAADKERWAIESALMKLLRKGGMDAVRQAVEAALPDAELVFFGPLHEWRRTFPDGRVLAVAARDADDLLSTSVVWKPAPPPLTARQKARYALHERFYALYEEAAMRVIASPRARLTPLERRAVLVGELEADVNNGGFSQYLLNKGRPRARQALAALESIGSRQVAALLRRALERGADMEELSARFFASREDLPALVLRSAEADG
jgi:hypothetical protein